jgi:Pentapeptide repeats (8 copies)
MRRARPTPRRPAGIRRYPLQRASTQPDDNQEKINWNHVSSLVTAIAAIGALVFTSLSLDATRDQIKISEQGLVADRFGRAVEQLGNSESIEVRLGGIYALERFARDSPSDHQTVIEVMAAFVRNRAGRPEGGDCGPRPTEEQMMAVFTNRWPEVPVDIQAAVTVLGRRDAARDDGTRIDLRHTCLRGVSFITLNFAGAIFQDADLSYSDARHANMNDANLTWASLVEVDAFEASFAGANFLRADLSSATLSHANLRGANLNNATLTGVALNSADLSGVDLSDVDLSNVGSR